MDRRPVHQAHHLLRGLVNQTTAFYALDQESAPNNFILSINHVNRALAHRMVMVQDQLRHRIACALLEIMVVSAPVALQNECTPDGGLLRHFVGPVVWQVRYPADRC